jgi:hypothetical protein
VDDVAVQLLVALEILLVAAHRVARIRSHQLHAALGGLRAELQPARLVILDTYCYQEQNSNIDFKAGKFRLAVRKMITEGHTPPIADVFQQNVDTLTLPMNAAAFSYVDYLIFKDGAKFKEIFKDIYKVLEEVLTDPEGEVRLHGGSIRVRRAPSRQIGPIADLEMVHGHLHTKGSRCGPGNIRRMCHPWPACPISTNGAQ